jgi:hypothetical protein
VSRETPRAWAWAAQLAATGGVSSRVIVIETSWLTRGLPSGNR